MLSKIYRISKKDDFERIKRGGRNFQSKFFGMIFLKEDGDYPLRFGFIVSNRISKKSSERNRIKRGLREAVRINIGKIKARYSVIFLAKKSLLNLSAKEIEEEVVIAFSKAGII